MAKTSVSAEQHLALLNKVLREQNDFREGMAFVEHPPGSRDKAIYGANTTTPYGDTDAYRSAERIVHELYEFDPGRE